MDVTLALDAREFIDLMNPPKLAAGTDIVVSQGRERDEFKRTVEDVKLKISDQQNELTNTLRKYPITSVWDVIVKDSDRQLFAGRIDRPVTSDVKEDWIEVQCFSKNKEFWEKAKVTKILPFMQNSFVKVDTSIYSEYVLVLTLLQYNLDRFAQEGIFAGYDIDALYNNRKIRWAWGSDSADVGNQGRYVDLDPKTTIYEILTAMAIYYNAEFFIDAETNKFTMIRRNSIQNDVEHDLDELLINTEGISFDDSDGKKYDYVKVAYGIPKPADMYTQDRSGSGIPYDTVMYTLKTIIEGIESTSSNEYDPYLLLKVDPYGGPTTSSYKPFVIPNPPTGFTYASIYQKGDSGWSKIIDLSDENISANATIFERTSEGLVVNITPTQIHNLVKTNGQIFTNYSVVGDLYIRYDELIGTWTTLFKQSSDIDLPQGKIFDSTPSLKFINPATNQVEATNYYWAYYFFGREYDINIFAQQFQDFFIYKGKISCTIKNLPYRVGDTFITAKHPKIPAGKYLCKNARNKLMREQTQIELIKI